MHDFYQEYVSSGQAGITQETLDCNLAPIRPYLNRLVRDTTSGVANPRIIDAACGSGKLVSVLRDHGFVDVTGVDVSKEQIGLGTAWGIQGLVCADVIDYLEQVDEGSVDIVYAMDFLEHLDIAKSLQFFTAVRRSLTRAGRVVLHVPNAESPFCNAVRYADITHERAFARKSLNQLLYPSRMRVTDIIEDRPPVHGLVSFFRRVIWTVWRSLLAVAWAAETGGFPDALTRNMLVVARPLPAPR